MKILVDLDVVTIALWNKDKEAVEFIENVKKGKFEIYTPHVILDLVSKWRYEKLKTAIKHFYELYSKEILTPQRLLEKFESRGVDSDKVVGSLVQIGVKIDDAALVLVASVFDVDVLITYNRKHFRSKSKEINEVLEKYGLRKISILLPTEI